VKGPYHKGCDINALSGFMGLKQIKRPLRLRWFLSDLRLIHAAAVMDRVCLDSALEATRPWYP
jgi:hypothetical protein